MIGGRAAGVAGSVLRGCVMGLGEASDPPAVTVTVVVPGVEGAEDAGVRHPPPGAPVASRKTARGFGRGGVVLARRPPMSGCEEVNDVLRLDSGSAGERCTPRAGIVDVRIRADEAARDAAGRRRPSGRRAERPRTGRPGCDCSERPVPGVEGELRLILGISRAVTGGAVGRRGRRGRRRPRRQQVSALPEARCRAGRTPW